MNYVKVCKFCGKTFETKYKTKQYCSEKCRVSRIRICKVCGTHFKGSRNQKFCSTRCRQIYFDDVYDKDQQLCWTCKRATGFCNWSAHLKPVKGWNAKKVKYDGNRYYYKIISCPLYLPDNIKNNKKRGCMI